MDVGRAASANDVLFNNKHNQYTHLGVFDVIAEEALGQGVVGLHNETGVTYAVVLLYTALLGLAVRAVARLGILQHLLGLG